MAGYDGEVRINTRIDIDDAKRQLGYLGDAFEDVSDGALGFSDVLKGNLLSDVIISGVQALGDGIKGIATDFIDAAASVKAESSQFEQTFRALQEPASEAIGRVAETSGVLETRLNTLGSQIYAFARSSGGDTEESMALMETALQAAADGAAYYDRSLENVTETLQSFLKGNFENDAALGVSATETTRNAAAMELFGEKFADLSEIQKQQTLLKMVTDAQALSGAMGQAAREADGWENVQGNLSEAWRQFSAEAGAPLLESLIPIIQDITTELIEWTGAIDWTTFSDTIKGFVSAIVDNGSTVLTVIAGVGAGFIAWNVVTMIQSVIGMINTFKAANDGLKLSQIALNAVMNANPLAIIATLIAGVVTALIVLWNTNEDFRNAVKKIWENIKQFFADAWESIKETWDVVKSYFENIWASIQEAFEPAVKFLGNMFAAAWKAITSVWDGVTRYFETVWSTIKGIFAVVESALSGDFEGAWEAIKGIVDGWSKYFSGIWEDIKGVFSDAWNVFKDIGKTIVEGIKQGISNAWAAFSGWVSSKLSSLTSGMGGLISAFSSVSMPSGMSAAYSVPALASGAVIPPNREFLAVLGDQKSGTNIEAPLETIKQAFLEAMQESGGAGGGTYTFVVNLDGKEIARNQVKHINNMTRMAGKPVILV